MTKASDNQFPKVTFAESAAPGTPASGLGVMYEKTDGKPYFKNDAGTEYDMSGGAGGAPTDAEYLTTAAHASLSAEKVVTAPASGGIVPKVVRKTADEIVNNSSVLQDDNHLLLALAVNEVWEFEADLYWDSGTTPDIKFAFTIPTGATLRFHHSSGTDAGGSSNTEDTTFSGSDTACGSHAGQGVGTVRHVRLHGFVATDGSNSGNLQLRWAQNTQNASDTTVFANSTLKGWKLA
jgi:hypothetical protein